MNRTVKRIVPVVLAALCGLTASAQWDMEGVQVDRTKWVDYTPVWNPDPQVMVPWGKSTGLQQQDAEAERTGKQGVSRQRRLADTGSNTLPTHWNNAETSYFPPVFNQAGGSCGPSSRIGYMLNEELNAYRGTNAKLDENHLAPNFQYPFSYNGTGKETMAYYVGYPDAKTYGGFPYSKTYGFYETNANNAGWMQGYDKWFISMHNRIWSSGNFPVGVIGKPTDNSEGWGYGGFGEGALAVKRWLYNHNGDDSFHTGGLLGLGCAAGTNHGVAIPQSSTNDELGVTGMGYTAWGTGVDHAITLVGYDDRIEFDLDQNGVVGERNNALGLDEVGAWIIVNSWGNWRNGGFSYVPYALGTTTTTQYTDSNNEAVANAYIPGSYTGWTPEFYNIRKDYSPERTIKVTMSFTQRSAIQLQAGISTNLNATVPDEVLTFHHFNYQGDGDGDGTDAMTPMLGRWANGVHYEPMEFGYDLTDLSSGFDRSRPLKYFFIINSKSTATGVGGIHSASIIDYAFNSAGTETPFVITGDSVVIGNGGTTTIISTIVYGEPVNSPTNLSLSGTTLSWEAPQGTAYTPDSYIIYKDGEQLATTTSLTYDIGSTTGSFTVAAHYTINGTEHESAATDPVSVLDNNTQNDLSFQPFITFKYGPLTTLEEITDGGYYVLYNTGRSKYLYDANGTYSFSANGPELLTPDDYRFVFKFVKNGSYYNIESLNGYLPSLSNNTRPSAASSAANYTVAVGNSAGLFTLHCNVYLNGNDSNPVGWSAGTDATSQYQIIPVTVSEKTVGTSASAATAVSQLTDGTVVYLKNAGSSNFVYDAGSSTNYGLTSTTPTLSEKPLSTRYLLKLNKSGSNYTVTSMTGHLPTLANETTFTPADGTGTFTITKTGNYFYLQSGSYYLNTYNSSNPKGATGTGNYSKWTIYLPSSATQAAPPVSIVDPGTVYAGVPVQLSLTGISDFASSVWTIEGQTLTSLSPTVTFSTSGSQTVQCVVTDYKGGTKICSVSVDVQAAPTLTAEFDLSAPQTAGSDRISFLPVNKVAGCTYSWYMPGAEEESATTRNASASYNAIGTKSVTLTVTDPGGESATYTRDFEVVAAAPKPDYQLSAAVILKNESLTITDKSKYSPTEWAWYLIGTNNIYSAFVQNPTFTIPDAGVYDLRFTASNEAGSNTVDFSRAVAVCNTNSYNGLNFNGGSMQLDVPLSNNISNAWTIDFWLQPTSFASPCFGITSSGGISIISDGAGTVSVKNGSTVLATSSTNYLIETQWHHYAITFDGTKIYFYRDGSLINSASSATTDFTGLFASLTVGGSAAPATGIFDEFRVWNTCLSQAKIRTYAVAPITDVATAMSSDGLDVYYQFNQASGNATDATTHGYTGIRSNFGPDGDAWSLSDGVFALSFNVGTFTPVGGLLDKTLYSVAAYSDAETSSETAPASQALDNDESTFWHSAYSKDCGGNQGYPHSITLDRTSLDTVQSIMLYVARAENYHPTSITVEESTDGTTWTTLCSEIPMLSGMARPGVVLPSPATKRYLRITFPTGGGHLALNEIYLYGIPGPTREIVAGDDAMVLWSNGDYTDADDATASVGGNACDWTYNDQNEITLTDGSTGAKVVCTRASSLQAGKQYLIFNTAYNNTQDRTGFYYANSATQLYCTQTKPNALTVADNYLWTVESDGNGNFYFRNVSTDTYISASQRTLATTATAWQVEEWTTSNATKAGVKSYRDGGTIVENANISTADKVFTVKNPNATGNSVYWNGNDHTGGDGGYVALWNSAHPFAFYEVGGYMTVRNDGTDLYEGASGTNVFNINADGDYVITGYEFDFTNGDASTNMTVIAADGTTVTCSGSETAHISVSGLSTATTSFTVSTTGTATSGATGKFIHATNFHIYYESANGPYTVTYRILSADGTKLYKTYTQSDVAKGTVVSALPSALEKDYCTYSTFSETVNSSTTIDVRCTWNGPFTISTANDTIYYGLSVRSAYVYLNADGTTISLGSNGTATDPAYKWAFFGNPYSGFYIVNAQAASNQYLTGATNEGGAASISYVGTAFDVAASSYSSGAFVLHIGTGDAYLNKYKDGDVLKTWVSSNALSDIGSAFSVVALGNYAAYVVSEVGPYMNNHVGSGYVGSLSSETYDSFSSEYTARSSAANFSQYWSLLNRVKAAVIPFVSGGYYRLRNNYSGRYAVMNNTDRLLYAPNSTKAEVQAQVGSVATLTNNGDDTWTITYQGVPLYGVTATSKRYGTDPSYEGATTQAVARFVSNGVPGEFAIYLGCTADETKGFLHANSDNGTNTQAWGQYAGASQWNIEPADVLLLTPNVVDGAGYTTLCLPFPATIDKDLADGRIVNYYILQSTTGDIIATSIVNDSVIPANCGVLLRNADGDTNPTVTLTIGGTPTADISSNVLLGTNLRIPRDNSVTTYVFSTSKGTKAFYRYTAANIAANKAYFTDGALAVRGFSFLFDEDDLGEITSIDDLTDLFEEDRAAEVDGVYDLQGRRVTRPQRGGVYITRGRKVYLK
ncbi:MAG: discoidin domain-containing protein [Bacteroidaceae bacterium]|nr:discoidin domain-containing protein [Bacteroidaceae bacterium]